MSLLIKGMEMPTSCWRCPLCLTVDPDTYRCIPTGQEFESTFDAIDHVVLQCPLVEIPPHGRLIDADAAKCKWRDLPTYLRLCECLNDSPTIIDAEEGLEE